MKIKRITALLLSVMMLLLCGCSFDTAVLKEKAEQIINKVGESGEEGNFSFSQEKFPKMMGSLAFEPMGEALTAAALGVKRSEAKEITHFGASQGESYKALCDKTADIIFAYAPTDEDIEYIEKSGREIEMKTVALDALVFLCHKDNNTASVSKAQLKAVYEGEIGFWGELSGIGKEITAYGRNNGSDSEILFEKLIGADKAGTIKTYSSMSGLSAAFFSDNNRYALGYASLSGLKMFGGDGVSSYRMMSVGEIEPLDENIASSAYPLTAEIYVAIRKSAAKESSERVLYNWITSLQGREIIAREGYIQPLV